MVLSRSCFAALNYSRIYPLYLFFYLKILNVLYISSLFQIKVVYLQRDWSISLGCDSSGHTEAKLCHTIEIITLFELLFFLLLEHMSILSHRPIIISSEDVK